MRIALLFIGILSVSISALAQPLNDDCTSATPISIPNGSTVCITDDNSTATSDGIFNACDLVVGDEIWFTFVATGSNVTATATPTGGGSAATDLVLTMMSQGCGAGVYDVCDNATGNNTATVSWGYSVGDQIWISIESNGFDGQFELCITMSDPPPTPGNTCATATASPPCGLDPFTIPTMAGLTGSGTQPSCFLGAGNQDIFIPFTVGQTGTLEWTATPLNNNTEYDWALYDITAGCPGTELVCNWHFANETGAAVGMGPTSCTACPIQTVGGPNCREFCNSITVTAGNTYLIYIDNYSASTNGSPGGFDFDWGNSTFLPAPTSQFTVAPTTGCGTVTACFGNNSIAAVSYAWDFGNGNTSTATNPPCQTYSTPGTYIISLLATSADGCTDLFTSSVEVFEDLVLNPTGGTTTCSSACDGTVSVSPTTGTGPYTYNWSNGCASSSCTSLCPGTYDVTVTDDNGCFTTSSATVTAGPPVSAGFTYNGNQCLTGNNYCFTNTGTTGISYSWDFGDGVGTSTSENPCYNYSSSGSFTVTQTVTQGPCTDFTSISVVVYDEPTPSVQLITDASCNGDCDGAIDITVNNGQSPYTYNWSNGSGAQDISGLCDGSYTVTVTDANTCQGTTSGTVNEPTILSATPSGNDAGCFGACDGDANATPSGGTAPYTYAWDDPMLQTTVTAVGLCAGTFNVTVTDNNGCIATGSVTIGEPAGMSLSFNTVDANCGNPDGSATVTVTGGSPSYTYLWSDGQTTSAATGLLAGGYSVTVTDGNSCITNGNVSVNDGGAPSATITDSTMATCTGGSDGSATVTPSGGTAPYTYSWSDGQSTSAAVGLSAGTYSVNVTDNLGCITSTTVTITEPSVLSASILSSNDPLCNTSCDGDATVTVTGGTGAYTYLWNTTPQQTVSTATGLCGSTSYTVTVTDANNCNTTDNISLTPPAALNLSITGMDTRCNGSSDGSANLTVSGGTPGYNFSWDNGATSEDLSNIAAGTYCVTVTDNNTCQEFSCVTISEPAALSLSTSSTDAYCGLANGDACVVVSGGTGPYTYLWDDPGAQTNSCASAITGNTTYAVTVTDAGGCIATDNVFVNDQPGFSVTAMVDNNASGFGVCDGQATALNTGGNAPFTYLWDDPAAQTNATATNLCAGTWCVTVTDDDGCTAFDCVTITEPTAMTSTILATDATCFGDCDGEADLTVTGGTPPYTFQWMPGGYITEDIVGLCAGTYYVTITDGNSIAIVDSINVNEPQEILLSIGSIDATCNAGCDGQAIATVTPSASSGSPYTYNWDDPGLQTDSAATGLCAGSYNLTVTSINGCTANGSTTINEPVAITTSTSTTDATCGQSNGSATANPSNGNAPYTYLWNDPSAQTNQNAINLSAATYQVIVTDANGCLDTAYASVANASGPTVTLTDSNDVSCFGACDGDATVSVTGGTAPLTYQWLPTGQFTPTASNLCAGTHIVQVTDASGCVSSVNVVINEPSELIVNATVLAQPNCNSTCDGVANVSTSGGTAPYTYQWDDPSLQTGVNATGLCGGTFNVVVTDNAGCNASGSVLIIEPPLLNAVITENDESCSGMCDGFASVIPSGGTAPYGYSWSNGDTTQTADSLCSGTYVINLIDDNGCTFASTATINTPVTLTASITNSQDASCSGTCDGFATIAPNGGTAPYTYSWSDGQTNATAINLCPGTYLGTVTDNNGCSDTASITIGQPSSLSLTVTKTDVTCMGFCDGTATVSVSGGQLPYTYQWDDPLFQTTPTADSLCDGIFTVTVLDANGCIASAPILIIEPTDIVINTTSINSTTCGFQNGSACVSISGGAFPYFIQWNDPLFTIGACMDSVFAGVYTVYVLDANSCFDSIPVAINDIAAATIDSMSTTPDNCYGDSIGTATVHAVTGNIGAITYIWKNLSGDTLLSGLGASSISNLAGGTYSVSIIDGGTGCISSEIFAIDQPSPLNTAIFPTNIQDVSCNGICDGRAEVSVSGGNLPYTYSWFPSGDVTAIASNLCAGTQVITVSDSAGCIDSSQVTITEPSPISATANITHISCNGGNDGEINLSPGPSGGTPPYAFTWYPPGIAGNTPIATNLTAGTDSVLITDFQGCTTSITATLTEPPALVIDSLTSINDNCGSSVGEATINVSGGTPVYTYSWNTNPVQNSSTATGLLAGNYTVNVTDFNGCIITGQAIITGTPGPSIDSVTVVDIDCFGNGNGSAALNISGGTAPLTYSWNDPSSQTTMTATGLGAGQYIATVIDANNCQDIEIVTINEPSEIMLLTFQDDYLICYGNSTQISAVAIGGMPPLTYSWNNGLPDTSSHSVSPLTTTTYTVTVIDANNCSNTDSLTITVNPQLNINTNGPSAICQGETASLSATPSGGNGGPYFITWDDGTGSTTETVIPGDSSSMQVNPSVTTTYTITVSDTCSTDETVTLTVQVGDSPIPGFYATTTITGCVTTFIDTSQGFAMGSTLPSTSQIALWEWDFGDGNTIGPDSGNITGYSLTTGTYDNPTHYYEQSGTYDVTVTVTDQKGCSSTYTISSMISVTTPEAIFSASPNPATMSNPAVNFADNSVGNIVDWYWDFGDGIGNATDQYPTYSYTDTGSFVVMLAIADANGCVDTTYSDVQVNKENIVYIPNIFDAAIGSDLFVSGVGIATMDLMIYDRWGELIFETKAEKSSAVMRPDGKCCYYGEGWDGTKNGESLSAQVMVYYLKAVFENGKEVVKKGNITLIK